MLKRPKNWVYSLRNATWLVTKAYVIQIRFFHEALKHVGAQNIFEYFLLSYQTMAIFLHYFLSDPSVSSSNDTNDAFYHNLLGQKIAQLQSSGKRLVPSSQYTTYVRVTWR